MTRDKWKRVNRARPCPVCGRPDWCLFVGPDDSPDAVICPRVESDRRAGEGGWLHRLRPSDGSPRGPRAITICAAEAGRIDHGDRFERLAENARRAIAPEALQGLAESLGLSAGSLRRLCVGWSAPHRAFTFPMRDASGAVVGIRLRKPDGRKLAVTGGREGLFLPGDLPEGGRLLVTEGPTDCAALLDLGFSAIGRPSCTGGGKHLTELVTRLAPAEVVVVADSDAPGRRGAESLAVVLLAYVPAVRIIAPPDGVKDARAWLRAGGTSADVSAAIEAAPVRRLRVETRKGGRRNG